MTRRKGQALGSLGVATGVLLATFGVAMGALGVAMGDGAAISHGSLTGLPPVPIPAENPWTAEKSALGERLFYEPGFSADSRVSCASCHQPERFFVDREKLPKGILGVDGARNASTVVNAAYFPILLADGRAKSLEDQVKYPITNPLEMNSTQDKVVRFLGGEPAYAPLFAAAFGDATVTWQRVTEALASFERTLVAGNSPFDRYATGDETALAAEARRGWELFRGKAGCVGCHAYSAEQPFFTDFDFHNAGVAWYPAKKLEPGFRFTPDLGRYWVTREDRHLGAYRTPSLRNVARTAPYMHTGELATLGEVVEHYSAGPRKNPYLDPRLKPLGLTAEEKADLVAFLESLTGEIEYQRPAAENLAAGVPLQSLARREER